MFSRIAQRASRLSSSVRATTGRRFFASSSMSQTEAAWSAARLSAICLGGLAFGIKMLSDKEKEYRAYVKEEVEGNVAHSAASKLPAEGLPGTNYERTFIAIKPDGVQRGLIGKIIQRFEEKGFTLVAMKLIWPTKEQAEGHYDDLKTKPFFKGLTSFFSSGPIVAMIWEGKGAILTGRRLLGETDPAKSPAGSIRGDYSIDVGRNIIHGSDGPEGAKHEIAFWFKDSEIYSWQATQNQHIYEKP